MPASAQRKRIVALDWDARSLRIVHAALGKRGVKIDRLLAAPMPPDVDPLDPGQMGGHIRRVLDQQHISTRYTIVDIPRDQAILTTLRLPTAAPDELPGMVEIQVAKELPFPADEAVIDFATPHASADDGPTTDVLVAAVRREVLQQYEATCYAAGLRLERIGLRPYASKVAIGELLKDAMPERVLFIDVMPTLMEIDVLREGQLVFSRAASVMIPDRGGDETGSASGSGDAGGEVDAPADEDSSTSLRLAAAPRDDGGGSSVRDLVLEVTRSIEAYRAGDHGARIDHVVVGGDVGIEDALGDAIQDRLHIPTERYNPARTFGWSPDEGAGAAAFASTLGLALGQVEVRALHFDFLHPKQAVSVARERLKKAPLAAGAVVLFVVAGVLGASAYTKPARDELARIEARIAELEAEQGEYTRFLKLMDTIEGFDTDQLIWVDVLYDIFSVLEDNKTLVLSQIEMNQKDQFVLLKTRTKDAHTATDVAKALQAFRREGCTKPRFKVIVGAQAEKRGQRYPYVQDLRIKVLNDKPRQKGTERSARRSKAL
ncbi:MAG: pilus assembly protein PilM [Phycisphaerae bacterium]